MAKIVEINKQELSTEKIQLNSVKEIQKTNKQLFKLLKEADESWKSYSDYLTGADKPFEKMISAYRTLTQALPQADSVVDSFLKAGKELGVDVSSNSEYKAIKANIKIAQDVMSVINSFKDPSSFQK